MNSSALTAASESKPEAEGAKPSTEPAKGADASKGTDASECRDSEDLNCVEDGRGETTLKSAIQSSILWADLSEDDDFEATPSRASASPCGSGPHSLLGMSPQVIKRGQGSLPPAVSSPSFQGYGSGSGLGGGSGGRGGGSSRYGGAGGGSAVYGGACGVSSGRERDRSAGGRGEGGFMKSQSLRGPGESRGNRYDRDREHRGDRGGELWQHAPKHLPPLIDSPPSPAAASPKKFSFRSVLADVTTEAPSVPAPVTAAPLIPVVTPAPAAAVRTSAAASAGAVAAVAPSVAVPGVAVPGVAVPGVAVPGVAVPSVIVTAAGVAARAPLAVPVSAGMAKKSLKNRFALLQDSIKHTDVPSPTAAPAAVSATPSATPSAALKSSPAVGVAAAAKSGSQILSSQIKPASNVASSVAALESGENLIPAPSVPVRASAAVGPAAWAAERRGSPRSSRRGEIETHPEEKRDRCEKAEKVEKVEKAEKAGGVERAERGRGGGKRDDCSNEQKKDDKNTKSEKIEVASKSEKPQNLQKPKIVSKVEREDKRHKAEEGSKSGSEDKERGRERERAGSRGKGKTSALSSSGFKSEQASTVDSVFGRGGEGEDDESQESSVSFSSTSATASSPMSSPTNSNMPLSFTELSSEGSGRGRKAPIQPIVDRFVLDEEGIVRLSCPFDIYFCESKQRGQHKAAFEGGLTNVGSVSSILEFHAFQDAVDWTNLQQGMMIAYCKKGIKPQWEDEANARGGRYQLKGLTANAVQSFFTTVAVAFFTGQLRDWESYNLVSLHVRGSGLSDIQLWRALDRSRSELCDADIVQDLTPLLDFSLLEPVRQRDRLTFLWTPNVNSVQKNDLRMSTGGRGAGGGRGGGKGFSGQGQGLDVFSHRSSSGSPKSCLSAEQRNLISQQAAAYDATSPPIVSGASDHSDGPAPENAHTQPRRTSPTLSPISNRNLSPNSSGSVPSPSSRTTRRSDSRPKSSGGGGSGSPKARRDFGRKSGGSPHSATTASPDEDGWMPVSPTSGRKGGSPQFPYPSYDLPHQITLAAKLNMDTGFNLLLPCECSTADDGERPAANAVPLPVTDVASTPAPAL